MGMYTENEENFNRLPRQSDDCQSTQSLLSAMNKFVHAINVMDDTVMIPSRLKDIPVTDEKSACNTNTSLALIPAQKAGIHPSGDLYSFYTMLNAIKAELVRGPTEEDDEAEEVQGKETPGHIDEQSRQTAAMFRHHLKGLFNLLHQLTDSANHLTGRYQQELGDIHGLTSNTAKISPFTL